MKSVDVSGESRYPKRIYQRKKINKLTIVKLIKFGKAFFLARKTIPSFSNNIKILVAIATSV